VKIDLTSTVVQNLG